MYESVLGLHAYINIQLDVNTWETGQAQLGWCTHMDRKLAKGIKLNTVLESNHKKTDVYLIGHQKYVICGELIIYEKQYNIIIDRMCEESLV